MGDLGAVRRRPTTDAVCSAVKEKANPLPLGEHQTHSSAFQSYGNKTREDASLGDGPESPDKEGACHLLSDVDAPLNQ